MANDKGNNQVKENIVKFILGGYAEFTIFQEPNIQYKYKIKKNQEGTLFFVYLKDGKGNFDYQGYLQWVRDSYKFFVGRKGNIAYNNSAINGLLWVLNRGDRLPSQVKIFHHGICSACGRKLIDAKSIEYGMGKTCRKRMGIRD